MLGNGLISLVTLLNLLVSKEQMVRKEAAEMLKPGLATSSFQLIAKPRAVDRVITEQPEIFFYLCLCI